VAAAAARAGLNFVVLTDHGDGTRQPDPPQYRSGVLVIDGVELSTQGGHYIAVGLPQAPYPLRGEARDVVEDVKRLGGFGVVAHPDSAKPELRWNAWDAPNDAIEWLNADTEWRDESRSQLARALARYPFRPAETVASLLDRPDRTLERWDALTQKRPLAALAGADAHARAGWMDDESNGYRRGWFLRIPSYDASFRAFANRVGLERPLGTDAATAAQTLLSLRAGRLCSAIDAWRRQPRSEFTQAGSTLVASMPRWRNDRAASRWTGRFAATGPTRTFSSRAGDVSRRVYLANAPGDHPFVDREQSDLCPSCRMGRQRQLPSAADASLSIKAGRGAQSSHASSAQVSQAQPSNGPTVFSYRLGEGSRAGQYAALVIGVGTALSERAHLAVRAHALRPMRVSVQARHPQSGERWQKSIYLDAEIRDIIIPFNSMTPVGTSGPFDSSRSDTVMFVVDLTNANPGTSGGFTIHDLRIER
jgi:hypothetical protein